MTEADDRTIDHLRAEVSALESRVASLEAQTAGQAATSDAWARYEQDRQRWEEENRRWKAQGGDPAASVPVGEVAAAPRFGGPVYAGGQQLPPPRQPRGSFTIEDLLSPRLLAWTGGAVLVAGIAFLVSIGIQDGWITQQMQLLGALLVCLSLLFAGFHLYEQKDQGTAALATFASGIAGLYATLIVMTQTYEILEPLWLGLVFAGGVAAVGTWAAWRWSSEAMAALALLGALLSPLLIGAVDESSTVWFALVGFGAVAVICALHDWQALMLGAVLVVLPSAIAPLVDMGTGAVVASGVLFWLFTLLGSYGFELNDPKAARGARALALAPISLAFVSLLSALLVGLHLEDSVAGSAATAGDDALGVDAQLAAWLIGFAALHAVIAAASAVHRQELTSLEMLLGFVAAALLMVGLSFALSGLALVGAWLILGVAVGLLGRGHGDMFELLIPGLALGAAALHIGAFEAPPEAVLSSGVDDLPVATAALVMFGVALGLLAALTSRPAMRVGLGCVSAISLVYLVSMLIVSAFQPADDVVRVAGETFGARQQGQALLSIFWALTALVAIVFGLKRGVREVRYAGLALLAVALCKIVLFDLTALDAAYRTGSFIAVGLMLLLAAFAYQNLKERVAT